MNRISLPLVGIVLACVLVALGAYVADWRQIGLAFRETNPWLVLLSLPFLIVIFALFAVRWAVLIAVDKSPPTGRLYRFLMVGYLANAILPARPGDVLRAVFLRQVHQIPLSVGLASIVLERLVDLAAICMLGILVSFLVPLPPLIGSAIYAVSGGTFGFLFAALLANRRRQSINRLVERHPRWFEHRSTRFAIEWLQNFFAGISVLSSARRLIACVLLTVLIWLFVTAFVANLLAAFRLPLPLSAALLLVVTTTLGSALPLSPGAIGVYHAAVVLTLALWQIDTSTAIAFAIALHALGIGFHIAVGLSCVWIEGVRVSNLSKLTQDTAAPF